MATGTLRENLAETRSLVHHLAAPNLESQPLDAALLAAARTYHPRAELRMVGTPIAIPAEVTHALLRITQSAVRSRVEQLGGTFTVESAPGEGTVVAAQIPCARGTAA